MALVTSKGGSSSSFSHRLENFDVFLTFRSEDARHSFISHLYNALGQRGIKPCIDDNLQKGEKISAGLLKIIESSRISRIVFFENYASSMWYLDELAKIIECKKNVQLVRLVFYNVNSSEVRKQKGKSGEALSKREEKIEDNKKVQSSGELYMNPLARLIWSVVSEISLRSISSATTLGIVSAIFTLVL